MKVTETKLAGVVIIEPKVFGDPRGFFLETFHARRYRDLAGIEEEFVQDNHSKSAQGVLRGLHLQQTKPQGKLVQVTSGAVFDVAADVNPDSPTFGQWVGVTLTVEEHNQFYIPPGYAHGFVVLSDTADFSYKCTDFYAPEDEVSIAWNDPTLSIDWPISEPQLSDRDRSGLLLSDL